MALPPNHRIGMLTPSIVDLYELQWLGVVDAARASGADLVCFVGAELGHPEGFRRQANAVYDLVSGERLDGLIVWTTGLELFVGHEAMERFCSRFEPLPIVSVETALPGATTVLMGEREGMHDVVSHLIEAHGCERIAFMRGPANHTGAQERFEGYREALARHGLPFDPALAPAANTWGPSAAGAAATSLLASGARIDAFATANDDLALGVLSALDQLDLRAPAEIAVVGFDDHTNIIQHDLGLELSGPEASGAVLERRVNLSAATLPLTTVRAPFDELGRRAVELLLDRLRGESVPDVVTIPTELVVRRSCGCFSSAVRRSRAADDLPRSDSVEAPTDWQQVAAEMKRELAGSQAVLPEDWPERLDAAFVTDAEGATSEAFLAVLDEFMRASIRAGETLESWLRALFSLRRHIATRVASARADQVWLGAQLLLDETAPRLSEYQHVVTAMRDRIVRNVGQRLVAAPDTQALADALAEELPKLDIPSCYLALYGETEERDQARPLLVYEGGRTRKLAPGEPLFAAKQLAPVERIGHASPSSLVAVPLYFKARHLGFALLEVGPRVGWMYSALQEQVASALQAVFLVERERRALAAVEDAHDELEERVAFRTAELEHANEVLTEQMLERERAEARQARLEAQLRQAQKMEAIGRLAGGIAHDFNNLLVVINGYSDLLLRDLPADDSMRSDVEEIQRAGERASTLTGQLLAFSRQQVLQPTVLSLNGVVTNVETMLRRLIGEDVELVTTLAPALAPVTADRGQIEQIVLNLALNARDAMPDGGRLTIETANVDLDTDDAHETFGAEPGSYVVLKVRDTGVGMDADTQARIFEPFFTTKPQGRGTGLGLATVFGIVQQSGGQVRVVSAPGQGSTFEVYLPRATRVLARAESERVVDGSVYSGSETILVVEDDSGVRGAARRFLEEAGYRVLEASDGREAVRVCRQHDGPLDLLITDVVMPGMSGRELVERLTDISPKTPVLYMSGHTDSAALRQELSDAAVPLLQKPFTASALAGKVRELLDRHERA